jgi:CRISPR/Cas system CMR subunit Cmr6 (Cas7 group RAMP superfamily)
MTGYKLTPKIAKEAKNLSLYYDKFVYKEKVLTEMELREVSSDLKDLLKSGDENNDIKDMQSEIKKIKTQWIQLNPNSKSGQNNIRQIKRNYEKVVNQTIKKSYKDKISNLMKQIKDLQKEVESIIKTRERLIEDLKSRGYFVHSEILSLETPFLVGAGIPSIDEVGLYWSRNHSVPIIPGSSIK